MWILFKKHLLLILLCITLFDGVDGFANEDNEDVIIFHAGSLSFAFSALEVAFESEYPDIDVKRESAGSRLCARKITDLKKRCDVFASADETVIETLLIPEYAQNYVPFATNEIVLMYTSQSQYNTEIASHNWFEILLRPDVTFGHSDPNLDPCGYRARWVWQLAEDYYNIPGLNERLITRCPKQNQRSKSSDLVALLESGTLDYAFMYRSVAEQQQALFIRLPNRINLSDLAYQSAYQRASVMVSGEHPGMWIKKKGKSILYALTVPQTVQNYSGARTFIDFLFSKKGQKILINCGHTLIMPMFVD